MTTLTGTGALARLALRLDRVRLTVWVLLLGAMPALTAAQYKKLYPTEESIRQVSGVIGDPSLTALNGPLFRASLGGLTAWKIGVTELILVALMSLLTVLRHTRTEEETGRLELVGAGVVGRYAPLTAALAVTGAANVAAAGLATLGLLATGLPVAGSVALGLTMIAIGALFAAVAAVAAQLTTGTRSAIGIASAVLGGCYLLRALGDAGPTAASWSSPLGWAMRIRPYAGERWWLLGPLAVLVVACAAAAYALAGRRDLGAGMLPQRTGPAQAAPSLRSPLALAWRLHRGLLLGWVVGLAVTGAVLGAAANGIDHGVSANQKMLDLLARMGGRKGLADAYLAACMGIVGMTVAVYTVQATLRLRAEETGGRLEPLLATRTGRIRWALGHLAVALGGSAVLLAVTGAAAGLAYGVQRHDVAGQLPRLFGAALAQLPATWVLAGLGVALFGLLPRMAVATWAVLIAALLLQEVGVLLGLSQWVMDASPFSHVPKLPGSAFTVTPLVWLTAVAAALVAAGLGGLRRRDIG